MSGQAAATQEQEIDPTKQQGGEQDDANKAGKAEDAGGGEQQGGEGGEDSGFDVVEESGANAGAGRVVPLGTLRKVRDKLKGRVRQAEGRADAASAETELLKLENQQLKEQLSKTQQKPMPKVEDFGGDHAKYEAAMRGWIGEVSASQRQAPAVSATQPAADESDDEALNGYAERAAKLKADDFEAAEDAVIEAVGPQAASQIIRKFANSEAVVYALGKNPAKLREIAVQLKADPVGAIVSLTQYASGLKLKPRGKAPDPNPAARGTSGGGGDAQQQLERLRELRQQGKISMREVLDFAKECRAKGIRVS